MIRFVVMRGIMKGRVGLLGVRVKNVLVGKGVGLRWVEGTDQAISRSKEFRALFLVSAKTTASKFAGCQISWGFRVGGWIAVELWIGHGLWILDPG